MTAAAEQIVRPCENSRYLKIRASQIIRRDQKTLYRSTMVQEFFATFLYLSFHTVCRWTRAAGAPLATSLVRRRGALIRAAASTQPFGGLELWEAKMAK